MHLVEKAGENSRIALVHDYFIQMGGAERVAEELHKLFPKAPMFTTVDKRRKFPKEVNGATVNTSWMQNLPGIKKKFRHYFALYPLAVETFDFSEFDLIVSSSSGYAKGVHKRPDAVHVCYCHTPMRWVWRYKNYAARERFGFGVKQILPFFMAGLKRWDLRASQQPDHYIVNSKVVANRVKEIYKRDATVIPPPVDVSRFSAKNGEKEEDFYLILSRLISYKRLDLAIEACQKMRRRLVVIGDGPDRKRLEKLGNKYTKFLGRQPDDVVVKYANRCRALLFPGEEDFGITPLELNAAGKPIIAFHKGGALETVLEGITGVFFFEQTADSMAEAIREMESKHWNKKALRRHARSFDKAVFADRILEFLSQVAPSSCSFEIPKAEKFSPLVLKKHAA